MAAAFEGILETALYVDDLDGRRRSTAPFSGSRRSAAPATGMSSFAAVRACS